MKALKIIGGIILVLILIFLLAGLVMPKVNYQTKVQVDFPLDTTFTLYSDASQIQKWIPEVKSIEPIEETTDVKGSSYKMVVKNNEQTIEMVEKILDYKENEKITLEFQTGEMIKTDLITFETKNGKTIIKHDTTIEGMSYLYKCIFAFFQTVFIQIDQQYLDNFKNYVEKTR